MPISGESLSRWVDDVAGLLVQYLSAFEGKYGYPPDENVVVRAESASLLPGVRSLAEMAVHADLLEFYAVVERVSLPDVGNGIFVLSAEEVLEGIQGLQPSEIRGALDGRIVVFGSDGGGGLFALIGESGQVCRLSGGAWVGSVYEVEENGIASCGANLNGFLQGILEELRDAVRSG
ncbi:hypothetical protein [Micromonospora sp. NPDC005652]|uniref:hypothetical protein n=1 Tax=Micromonospora sp. NPDC005652 TaxID=3157046 RepID=UPI0033D66BFF